MAPGAAALTSNMDRSTWGKRELMRLASAAIWLSILVVFLTRFSLSRTPPYVRSVFNIPDGWVVNSIGIEYAADSFTPGLVVHASEPCYSRCLTSWVDIVLISFTSEADAAAQFDAWTGRFYIPPANTPTLTGITIDRQTALGNRYHSYFYYLQMGLHSPDARKVYVIQACNSVLIYRVTSSWGSPYEFNPLVMEAEKALTKAACP